MVGVYVNGKMIDGRIWHKDGNKFDHLILFRPIKKEFVKCIDLKESYSMRCKAKYSLPVTGLSGPKKLGYELIEVGTPINIVMEGREVKTIVNTINCRNNDADLEIIGED
jgi:hypothetical protein